MSTFFLRAYASAPNSTTSTGQGDTPISSTRWICFATLPLIYTGTSLDWRPGRGSICCKYIFKYKYKCRRKQLGSIVQVQPFINSYFGSSTRGGRHNSYYVDHTMLTIPNARRILWCLKISLGRDPKTLTTSSTAQIQLNGRESNSLPSRSSLKIPTAVFFFF